MTDMPQGRAPVVSALKLALMAREVRAQAQAVLRADPIAIVGMACRVPGGDSVERLWQLVCAGTDAIREVPPDRWDIDRWFDPDPAASGKILTRHGGFLERIDAFDADYFGILPREAERMDPQQRLFLEVALEAIEDAGLPRERLQGSRTGVFVASYHSDYAQLQYRDVEDIDARTLMGTMHCILSGRLSHFLDLRGPNISIDTGCSASLVSIHLACQSLRSGESDLAIAGGVSLMVAPELLVSMSKVGFMAPDGRCKTFDATADGFGRGEGCGIVVLKRLSDAVADGDRVLAVVRGSAVNQDGHSTLIAAPSGPAQESLIREALANAQVDPGRIGLMETHGTGTALGDPIELEAIAATIGRADAGAGTCWLGAVKANLGHLEAASGVTGVIKAVLALRHQAIPPQLHFTRLNPHASLEGTRLAVPTRLEPWPAGPLPRCAAVSSFGMSGTNAHVILEEAPRLPAAGPDDLPDTARILPLSAQSPAALKALAESWVAFLSATDAGAEPDIAYTAAERRTHHDCRLAVVGRTREQWRERLAGFLRGEAGPGAASGQRRASAAPRLAFVFSGQGPQWHAMGRELLAGEPAFRAVVEECDALLRPLSGWSLLDELAQPENRSRLARTDVAQPALFALQAALAALWKSWGVVPEAVVGHSVGEIAALHAAGVLALPEAVRVVWHRGRIMQEATGLGRMASVGISPDAAAALVRPFGDRLGLAAINAPGSVVLSGEAGALEEALATLARQGVSHRMLPVDYAFHSAQMAPFQERLVGTLGALATAAAQVEFFSTVTGGAAGDLRIDAGYIGRNVREPVRLAGALEAMVQEGFDIFVEIAPHPVLGAAIADTVAAGGHRAAVVASLRRGRPERETMLEACAGVYAGGVVPDWSAFQQAPGQVVSLPAYPWQRRRHWIRPTPKAEAAPARRVFEGAPADLGDWIVDHRVFGHLVLPAAAVMEMFAAAAGSALGTVQPKLGAFAMERPLFVPDPGLGGSRWQTVATFAGADTVEIALEESVAEGEVAEWRRIATATARAGRKESISAAIDTTTATDRVDADAVYARFAELGIAFGPAFRGLEDIRVGPGVAQGGLRLPAGLEVPADGPLVHPALLDGVLQLALIAGGRAADGAIPATAMLPIGAEAVLLARVPPGVPLFARARIVESSGPTLVVTATLEGPDGDRFATIEGLRLAHADSAAFAAAARGAQASPLYAIDWLRGGESPSVRAASVGGQWLVFADRGGTGEALARELGSAGARCCLVFAAPRTDSDPADRQVVDPADGAGLARVLVEAGGAAGHPLRGIVHMWNLDLAPLEEARTDADREDLLGTGSLLHIVQALASSGRAGEVPLHLVTRGAQVVRDDEPAGTLRPRAAGSWGLAGVVRAEHPELRIRALDLDPREAAGTLSAGLLDELLAPERGPDELALREGQRWLPRLGPYRAPHAVPDAPNGLHLALVRPGTLDGVELRPVARCALRPDEVRLDVLACGLNFRDVLVTLGMYPGDPVPLGAECAGVLTEVGAGVRGLAVGERVFAFAPDSLGTECTVAADFVRAIPAGMSPTDAAALPVAFLTACYGLDRLAGLRRGERVLIHAAAGGVGLAAVQLALRRGAEVFATAGSEEKRERLRAMGVAHVLDSRSLAFADEILARTAGAGVHVVLNSLAADFIPATLRALGPSGRFLEIGKRGILSAEQAARERPDIAYHAFDLGAVVQADRPLLRSMLDEILAAFADGSLRPLPVTTFPMDDVRDAFRFMAQARHIGKIVVLPKAAGVASPWRGVESEGTYWITGGLGALGLETARWLARAGARHLVLSGRRPPGAVAARVIAELEGLGVEVRVFAADAADTAQVRAVLAQVDADMPPLRGIVHAAGLLRDGVLHRQRWEDCRDVLRGKTHGAWVLHALTRERPLDFFVLYSAAGVLLGAPGQGAYPAANAELDALARARRRLGLTALSVAWGAWAGAGMAVEQAAQGRDVWAERGLRPIVPAQGFAMLERLLREDAVHAAVLPIHWGRFLAQLPPSANRDFFGALAPKKRAPQAADSAPASVPSRLRALPLGQRRDALVAHLAERALHVLGLDPATRVEPGTPLKEIGLDSLMAVELRNALGRSLGEALPATLLFDYPTLEALSAFLARVIDLEIDAPREPATAGASEALAAKARLAALTDEEAEALLLAELDAAGREGRP